MHHVISLKVETSIVRIPLDLKYTSFSSYEHIELFYGLAMYGVQELKKCFFSFGKHAFLQGR